MKFRNLTTYIETDPPLRVSGHSPDCGYFTEKEHGNHFIFEAVRRGEHQWGIKRGFTHVIYTKNPILKGESDFRYAVIFKTAAFISIDQDSRGCPIIDKWNIKL